MHKAAADTAEGELRLRRLFEQLPAAVYVTDADGRFVWCNPAMLELAGGDSPENVALNLLLPDGTPLPPDAWPMTYAHLERREAHGVEVLIEKAGGTRVPVIIYSRPYDNDAGGFAGTISLLANISSRKDSEFASRERLAQLIHREKNEIQMIQSLLAGVQREATHPQAKDLLAGVARRIAAVAAAQTAIGRAEGGTFEAQALLQSIGQNASQSFGAKLDIAIGSSGMRLPVRSAVPIAIIASELIANAVLHARGDRNRVAVRLDLQSADGESRLMVKDDGPGFKPGPPTRRASGLGLVEALARQLGGRLEVTVQQGACCVVRFTPR
ncbi:MAG TPA: PAS domain-containing protein [Micropepsaceae bacterium]|nr:PAS domain-containing protein [Micropepsaceae bacterium]